MWKILNITCLLLLRVQILLVSVSYHGGIGIGIGVECFNTAHQTNIIHGWKSSSSISSGFGSGSRVTTSLWQKNNDQRRTNPNDNDNESSDVIATDTLIMDESSSSSSSSPSSTRRAFLTVSSAISASFLAVTTRAEPSSALSLPSSFPIPILNPNSKTTSLSIVSNTNATAASAIRQPNREGPMFVKGLGTESCLLKLLPVKKPVFRKLEKQILAVTNVRSSVDDLDGDPPVKKTFTEIQTEVKKTLKYLDDQRMNIEPIFKLDDPTIISIRKAERGEYLAEKLREELVSMLQAAEAQDDKMVSKAQKRALRALAEVGELLVEKFPYDVPSEGKFSYLPRLLGRAKVTFTIVRPKRKKNAATSATAAMSSSSSSSAIDKDVTLGNVTILADGFAAPITAGNFVDLSVRNFYTGLPVKNMKKRLGVNPTLTTTAEDSVVAYDIATTVDQLEDRLENFLSRKRGGVGASGSGTGSGNDDDNGGNGSGSGSGSDDGGGGGGETSLPILGSFNEGFYDPLTAKPRRIPLEIVQYDSLLGRARLSYESGFTGGTIASSNKGTSSSSSTLPMVASGVGVIIPTPSATADMISSKTTSPLLTFDIPGLVAMNHPDKNLNGASSEFFSLPEREIERDSRTPSLLNGQYAPFGYVVEGLDIMKNLEGNDVISATYVNEWGQLNLNKIRGTSFADALASSDDADV